MHEGVYGSPLVVYTAAIMRHFDARAAVGYGITSHWYRLCQPIVGPALWDVVFMAYHWGAVLIDASPIGEDWQIVDTDELRSWGTIRYL
jgi:hypothetical protein